MCSRRWPQRSRNERAAPCLARRFATGFARPQSSATSCRGHRAARLRALDAESLSKGEVMARPPSGSIVERRGKRGTTYGLRFRAYGKRHYLTADARSRAEAETRSSRTPSPMCGAAYGTRQSASRSSKGRRPDPPSTSSLRSGSRRGTRARRTRQTHHRGLPMGAHPPPPALLQGPPPERESPSGRSTATRPSRPARESSGRTRSTRRSCGSRRSSRLQSSMNSSPANPAAGKRRRRKSTRPDRASVEPEQLMALLEGAGLNRPLIATLAGTGLALERRSLSAGTTWIFPRGRFAWSHDRRPMRACALST